MLINKITRNFRYLVLGVFSETYPSHGKVPAENINESEFNYLSQPLVILTSFLDLPNQKRANAKLTITDVFKNMIDWEFVKGKQKKFRALDAALAIPMFIYYLLHSLIKLPFNFIKLLTEFLPGLAEAICYRAMDFTHNTFLYNLAKTGYFLFNGLHFVGRAFTSPVKSLSACLNNNNQLMGFLSILISGLTWGIITACTIVFPIIPLYATNLIVEKLFGCIFAASTAYMMGILIATPFHFLLNGRIVKPFLEWLLPLAPTNDSDNSNKPLPEMTPTEKMYDAFLDNSGFSIPQDPDLENNPLNNSNSSKVFKPTPILLETYTPPTPR